MSSMVHLLYGLYIFSSAVAGDLSQVMNDWFRPNTNIGVKTEDESRGATATTSADGLPPIVLVHGIFGFGKGVCALFSYFYFYFLKWGFNLFRIWCILCFKLVSAWVF